MAGAKAERTIADLEVGVERRRLDSLLEVGSISSELQFDVGGDDKGCGVRGEVGVLFQTLSILVVDVRVKVVGTRRKGHVLSNVELGIGKELAVQPVTVDGDQKCLEGDVYIAASGRLRCFAVDTSVAVHARRLSSTYELAWE